MGLGAESGETAFDLTRMARRERLVSEGGKASERAETWTESWTISSWLLTKWGQNTSARRTPTFIPFPQMITCCLEHLDPPSLPSETSHLLLSPGGLNFSLAAVILFVLVPIRELTFEALLLLLLPRPETAGMVRAPWGRVEEWSMHQACSTYLCLCVGVWGWGWEGCLFECLAKCLSAGVATENRSAYSENKMTAWDLPDKLKDCSERGRLK